MQHNPCWHKSWSADVIHTAMQSSEAQGVKVRWCVAVRVCMAGQACQGDQGFQTSMCTLAGSCLGALFKGEGPLKHTTAVPAVVNYWLGRVWRVIRCVHTAALCRLCKAKRMLRVPGPPRCMLVWRSLGYSFRTAEPAQAWKGCNPRPERRGAACAQPWAGALRSPCIEAAERRFPSGQECMQDREGQKCMLGRMAWCTSLHSCTIVWHCCVYGRLAFFW